MTEALSKMDGETPIDKAVAYVKLTDLRIWTGTYASRLNDMMPDSSSSKQKASIINVRASQN
ncbi:hypothetical protein, partial [Mycobacterium tuberculosis]|uniref:hypothetical protein n=1 Tax=Mycobacterium tuberculosis TaxID=1773 RepID=UPI001AE3EF48